MDAIRRLAWGCIGLCATGALALAACGGELAVVEQKAAADAAPPAAEASETNAAPQDAAAPPTDARAEPDAEEADAPAEGEGPTTCVKPTLPRGYFCSPPGGTISTAFDPTACGVAGAGDGAACRAQCAAWFGSPLEATFCVAADAPYVDAGPSGWLVCACNIP